MREDQLQPLDNLGRILGKDDGGPGHVADDHHRDQDRCDPGDGPDASQNDQRRQ